MAVDIRGYSVIDVVRLNAGSPQTFYTFSRFNNTTGSLCDALMINNLGSNNVFVVLGSGTALTTGGSTMMLIPANGARSLDYRCGSLSIASSGGNYNTEVEVIGLGV